MILKYDYLPFSGDDDLATMAGRTMLAHNSRHRLDQFHGQLLTPASYLGVISWFQQLYIFAHGLPGVDYVMDTAGGRLGVVDLAKRLRDQGLPPSIRTIKLWVCSAGAGAGDALPTGERFKTAMRNQ